MNSFFENWGPGSFDSSLWHLAGWTMCYFLVAGTAIGLAGTLLRFLCRRAAPTLRYAISLATFATLALLPIAIAAWLIPPASTAIDLQTPAIAQSSWLDTPTPIPQNAPNPITATPTLETTAPTPTLAVAQSPRPDDGAMVIIRQAIAYLPWLWIFGAPITFALLATGLVGSTRMRRNSEPITTGVLADSCNRLRKSLNVTRRVSMALCDRIAQPVLVGIVRPLILLPPAALTGWSPDELEMVLLHELAHVRRWDNLVNLLQRIVESLLFFHPAVWLVSRQVRRDREECCDAVVVAHTAKPQAYAELLVNIAAATPSPLAGLALARHPLTQRIRRILKLEDEPMLVSRNTLGAFTLAALTLVAVVLWQPTTTSIAEEPDTSVASEGITTEDTESTEEEERTAEIASETKTKSQKQTFLGDIFGRKLRYSTTFTSPLFEEYRKRGPREYEIYQQTQLALIKSKFILNSVLQDKRIAKLLLFKKIAAPLEWLRNNLHVSFLKDAPLFMNIYLEAPIESKEDVKDLKAIVDLVIKRYKTEITQKQKGLAEERKSLENEIKAREKALADLKAQLAQHTYPTLLYDGKTFDQWQQMWKTELKTEKRTECIKALAAFGRAGRGKEAVEAILDVAGEYDFLSLSDDDEGKFKKSVLELFSNRLPASLWFTPLMKRYESDEKRWKYLVSHLFYQMQVNDEKTRRQLLSIANSDHRLRLEATRALVRLDANLKHPETVELARKALQGEHPNMSVLYQLRYQHLDQVPEQFDMLLHEDPEIRKSARRIFINNNRIQPLLGKLMKVLDDPAQSKKHIYAIRALSYAKNNPRTVSFLKKIIREGDEQLLGPALFAYQKIRGASGILAGEDGFPEDRKKLLNDFEAMQKLVDQEKQLMLIDNYESGGGRFGGGGGGGGFF